MRVMLLGCDHGEPNKAVPLRCLFTMVDVGIVWWELFGRQNMLLRGLLLPMLELCMLKLSATVSDRGLPLSQLGYTLCGSEENRVKCQRKKGYFTRRLPPELPSGYIRDFVMNHAMRSLYPCNSAVWRCDVEGEGVGEGREILLLFKCAVSGSVYDLGAVSRRHSGSGEPTAWQRHSSSTLL